MRFFQFLLILLFSTSSIFGQSEYKVQQITPRDGLPFRLINYVFQDSMGFMWFGTGNGFNRYDGNEWQAFNIRKNDVTNYLGDQVHWIEETSNRGMILGTGRGLLYVNTQSNKSHYLSLIDKNVEVQFPWSYHFKTKSEVIYVISYSNNTKGRLYRVVDDKHVEFIDETVSGINFYTLKKLWEDQFGNYWFTDATRRFYKFHIPEQSWEVLNFKEKIRLDLGNKNLPIDTKNQLWIPIEYPLDANTFTAIKLPDYIKGSEWKTFNVDNHKNIWLKAKRGNLIKYDRTTQEFHDFGIVDNVDRDGTFYPFIDKEGSIWLPHYLGLFKFIKKPLIFENYLKIEKLNEGVGFNVYPIVEGSDGKVYLLEKTRGLFCIDLKSSEAKKITWKTEKLDHTRSVLPPLISSLKDPYLWQTIGSRLIRFQPEEGIIVDFSAPFFLNQAIYEDEEKNIWLICSENKKQFLCWFDQGLKTFNKSIELEHPVVCAIYVSETNITWVKTTNGILRIDMADKKTKFIDLKNKVNKIFYGSNNLSPFAYHAGYLWLSSYNGLVQLDPTSYETRIYTTEDGLAHNLCYTIEPEGENLWLGTQWGLSRLNLNNQSIKNFYVEDGLTHNEFNRGASLLTSEGKMVFGGLNGINVFEPKILNNFDNYKAPLVLTSFTILDEHDEINNGSDHFVHEIEENNQILLNIKEKAFKFGFSLLNYSDSDNNTYFHILEGFENRWRNTGNTSSATYYNIPPGNYTFRARAVNHRGVPGKNELAISIIVPIPWWNTWWAYSLIALLLISTVILIRLYELKGHRARSEARRLKYLDREKTKLFHNITHEFRTPLTVIMGMANQIQNKPEQAKNLIKRNSQILLQLINQMLDLSKIETTGSSIHMVKGDVVNYLKYVSESFKSYAEAKSINLFFYSELDSYIMDFEKEKLQEIISNLLSNAVKFTDPGGSIIMHLNVDTTTNPEQFTVKVKDNGIGIDSANQTKIFQRFYQEDDSSTRKEGGTGIGLALAKELVELLDGDISVRSTIGEGSEFKVTLPVSKKAKEKWDSDTFKLVNITSELIREREVEPSPGDFADHSPVIPEEAPENACIALSIIFGCGCGDYFY